MKLYLDMCCLKRSFDDQTQARIRLETIAVEAVLQLCREGAHQLLSSAALRFENSRNPNLTRKQLAEAVLALATIEVPHTADLEQRAMIWQNAGIGLLDALHLASAEVAQADRFATCDDRLINRASKIGAALDIVTALELFKELVP